MTTIYRNAASVAEARVLELTAQWESSLKSKTVQSESDTSEDTKDEASASKSNDESRDKSFESKESKPTGPDKEPA